MKGKISRKRHAQKAKLFGADLEKQLEQIFNKMPLHIYHEYGFSVPEAKQALLEIINQETTRADFAKRNVIIKLMREYANTPLAERKNGWHWLKKASYRLATLKSPKQRPSNES